MQPGSRSRSHVVSGIFISKWMSLIIARVLQHVLHDACCLAKQALRQVGHTGLPNFWHVACRECAWIVGDIESRATQRSRLSFRTIPFVSFVQWQEGVGTYLRTHANFSTHTLC